MGPEHTVLSPRDWSLNLRDHGVCFARFWTSLGLITLPFLLLSPFWNGNVYSSPFGFTGS